MKALLLFTTTYIMICSCTHEPYLTPIECTETYFVDDIKPLLMKSCGSNTINCHYSETNYNKKVALYLLVSNSMVKNLTSTWIQTRTRGAWTSKLYVPLRIRINT